MPGVDDTIVEMKFDNAAFESKISETIKSLDKLRASLDFANARKSMGDLSAATKSFNMDPMGHSIEDISRKFLAMSTIAITALSNITSHALAAAGNMVKAFTFGPIQAGFQEMETNMNSIQTILANTESKGTNLDQVNAALQKLNEYSDKTIYNFSQMAKNIGTFTAAGVDLDTSVNSIKGIANLAAVSGSSAEQASGAMYQLSQAIAAGSLKLIDWNSVVNAGMGGEVFKTALFETAKAAGTLTNVPVGQTFKEWEEANGSFRESLQDGWVTSEVLTTTLSTFTGDLSDAELKAKGFTDAQIANIHKLAKTATGAATEVKTFTQLIGTVKESIATGWADTFKIVVGNFDEAKRLFTGINNAIGGFVGRASDARNEMLNVWKFMGGRDKLLQGLENGFGAIGRVISAVSKAFRDIFPKRTGQQLFVMTERFAAFTDKLEELAKKHMPTIQHIFKGFFAAVEIGISVFKGIAHVVKTVFAEIGGAAGGPVINFIKDIASSLIALNESLISGDNNAILEFFDSLADAIKSPGDALDIITGAFSRLFDVISGGNSSDSVGRISDRFDGLKSTIGKIGDAFDWIIEKTKGVRQALGDLWNYITQFFRELGDSMKSEMEQGDFEGALDIFNVAFLGGIAALLYRFFKKGIKFDFGGGIIDRVRGMLDQLTGTLKAMQTELKSRALMQIAIAMGVLTVSLVALSLIDSAALTKALAAMAVGFAELVGAMVAIDQLMSTFGALKFAAAAAGMVLLAGSMILLGAAMKIFATMSWEEMAKGLVGVAGGLTAMVTAINFITADTDGLVKAGIAMLPIAVALRILANAMQAFATMGWEELGKGFTGVASGLLALVLAMNKIPTHDMIQAGVGILAIAVGMRILANAMQAFATMSWEEMAKGLLAVGAALGIIVLLTNTMPAGGMIGIGVGLIAVGVALNIVAKAVQTMGKMKLGTLAKGLGAVAAIMLVLAVGTNAMTNALPGAAAMVVVAGALLIMAEVIGRLSELGIGQLVASITALAAIFAVLGGAAYFLNAVIAPLTALGVALTLIGVGMAAFGVGAYLVVKAFDLLGKTGKKSMQALIEIIAIFVARAPLIGIAIASVIVSALTDLAEAAPALIKALKVVLLELLEALKELIPKAVEVVSLLITSILTLIREKDGEFIQTGYDLILDFLKGIRDNIGEIVGVVSDIIQNFLDAFADEVPDLVDSLVNLLTVVFTEVAYALGELMPTLTVGLGISFVEGFWEGMKTQAKRLGELVMGMIDDVIGWFKSGFGIFSPSTVMMDIGKNIILGLWNGILSLIGMVKTWFIEFPLKALAWIGDVAGTLFSKGVSLIGGLLGGIVEKAIDVMTWYLELPGKILGWIGPVAKTLFQKGYDLIVGLFSGVLDKYRGLRDWFLDLPSKIWDLFDDAVDWLVETGKDIIRGLWDGIKSMKGWLEDKAGDIAGWVTNPVGKALEVLSPSRVFMRMGVYVGEGLIIGIDSMAAGVQKASASLAAETQKGWEDVDLSLSAPVVAVGEVNPVITPVLDLTEVRLGFQQIEKMLTSSAIDAGVSLQRAQTIAVVSNSQNGSEVESPVPVVQEIKFEQNNYSPEALSANDIYRNTKNQLALAKEELNLV